MKTIINKILLFVMLFAGAASLHGCSDPDGIIEDIAYDREFSPLNFTYTLTNNVNVAFSWTVMTGVSDYTLTLSYTDGDGGGGDRLSGRRSDARDRTLPGGVRLSRGADHFWPAPVAGDRRRRPDSPASAEGRRSALETQPACGVIPGTPAADLSAQAILLRRANLNDGGVISIRTARRKRKPRVWSVRIVFGFINDLAVHHEDHHAVPFRNA